jgi:UDP-N-acetylglucosamine 2-epimerase (non-hydrolysing)
MPEEHNRVLTDHAADLLLAPTEVAAQHLANEGLSARTVVVGDVMTDVCFSTRDHVQHTTPKMPNGWSEEGTYLVSTIHRQENTDDAQRLGKILSHLASSSVPVRLLAHPRLKSKAEEFGLLLEQGNISVFDPLSYPQLVHAVMNATGVVTDSGGLQKEAFLLGAPCITVRTETEWTETVDLGWNTLIPECDQAIDDVLHHPRTPPTVFPYGTGNAAQRAVEELEKWQQKDPVERTKNYLRSRGIWNENLEQELLDSCAAQIDAAMEIARNTPLATSDALFEHVYAEPPQRMLDQKRDWANRNGDAR